MAGTMRALLLIMQCPKPDKVVLFAIGRAAEHVRRSVARHACRALIQMNRRPR